MTGQYRDAAAGLPDRYIPERGNPGYRVQHYDLDLVYRVSSNYLVGRVSMSAVATASVSQLSVDSVRLAVSKVWVNGKRVSRFDSRETKLNIWLDHVVQPGDALKIDIGYSANPQPLKSLWGEVGWEELTNGSLVAGQPHGAAGWFPGNDHPSQKASFRFTITTDSPYTVIANGVLESRRVRAAQTTWIYYQSEPMATYLAAVHIGQYELIGLTRSRVRQQLAVPVRLKGAALQAFARQPEMLELFEELFGPYPFAGYTVVVTDDDLEIPLEAQGMSVFGANFVDQRESSQRLIAHELAHQWFGNSLTVGTWQDIWLNEGFACYAEWLWSEVSGGPTAAIMAGRAWARLADLGQDLVIADPGPKRMFDDRLYKRGALTLHALRESLGDSRFFALLREWVRRNRHSNITTGEFVVLAQEFGDQQVIGDLLWSWLALPQLPALP